MLPALIQCKTSHLNTQSGASTHRSMKAHFSYLSPNKVLKEGMMCGTGKGLTLWEGCTPNFTENTTVYILAVGK